MSALDAAVFPFSVLTKSGSGILYKPTFFEDADEFLYVESGTVRVFIGTYSAIGKQGTIFYIPKGMVRRAEVLSDHATLQSLLFSHASVEEKLEKVDFELCYMFDVQSKNRIFSYTEEDGVYPLLLENLMIALDEFCGKDVCYRLNVFSAVYKMVAAVLRYYFTTRGKNDETVYHNVLRFKPVLDYISLHYLQKIYVEDLAELMMVSADHFTKLFKDSIGTTPIDYINTLRVNRAMILLASDTQSVAEISEVLGFSGPNHFHKIFKSNLEMSPLAYRKMTRE